MNPIDDPTDDDYVDFRANPPTREARCSLVCWACIATAAICFVLVFA